MLGSGAAVPSCRLNRSEASRPPGRVQEGEQFDLVVLAADAIEKRPSGVTLQKLFER